jgi:tetrahydromethanopterin S-methyltransferase subunit F
MCAALQVPGLYMGFKVLEISGFHHGVVEAFALLGS